MHVELSGKTYRICGKAFQRATDLVWDGERQMTPEEFEALAQDDREYLLDAIEAYKEHSLPPPTEIA